MSTENLEDYPDRIADMFSQKTLLITGGTGFMGKVLVEKLLRVCNVKKMILLVRGKKGKLPKERLREIFAGPVSLFYFWFFNNNIVKLKEKMKVHINKMKSK